MLFSHKIKLLAAFGLLAGTTSLTFAQRIDRYALVSRHNVTLKEADPLAPLSVGNGDFAYTADVTGMQSLEGYYYKNGIPLETMCTWAWHSFPNTKNLRLEDAMKPIDFHGRQIMYASQEKSEAGDYYRQNPHPVPLGQISLMEDGKALDVANVKNVDQTLDLWRGLINSKYELDGQPVSVQTVSHPERSMVAFSIKSALLKSGKLTPAFRFPYAYDLSIKNKPPFDWSKPDRHQTTIVSQTPNSVLLKRSIEGTVYYVSIHWQGKARLVNDGKHYYHLDAAGSDSLQLVCEFMPSVNKAPEPTFATVKAADIKGWADYWQKGGVADFSGSKDPRANELERRIVLSQYLLKINYAGSFPPQETGLTHISWYGKHNSEVYWWHTAQFYEWGHTDLLEKSFNWYKKILPKAIAEAKREGFDGARWPKMAGIDGRTSPGSINPFIIWNQPNPIYLAELIYRANPTTATLKQYSDVVFESAKFLASYAFFDAKTNRYVLGPPIKAVNEHTEENATQNPTFELVQWYYGLKVAQDWRVRMGLPRDAKWDDILQKLSRPTVSNGKYLEIETEPSGGGSDMIMALGYMPQTPMIDPKIMANTFDNIYQRGSMRSFISWSLGKGALTAARLGEQEKAVNILCNDTFGAHFLKNGHVQRAKEPLTCPAYLPANSAFMAAAGLMVAGWDGGPKENAPGFPQDGSWHVRSEGLNKLP
ncbi:hypothetical protein C8P68_102358 [Mucilaginibacter yixingensis]|uniref:Glycosyl hydrolase family 65 n=1 Tax=Mucilaginibacter yixingensis TaxID=1295612 RepID=A0A2T5JCQ1_9SPHI|nr:hypothetical protein [Mucilaginibacter yixingensis]PTQ99534.1 hypothetical protein C8P68_102358 [Mucilaginibacter yixingensis]